MATFFVNGQAVTAKKNQTLLRFLRDELQLTSVKDGCSEGACGACTVLIDGETGKEAYNLSSRTNGGRLVHLKGDPALIGSFADVTISSSNTWALYGSVESGE